MDVVVTTSDPSTVTSDAIRDSLERDGWYVTSVTIHVRR